MTNEAAGSGKSTLSRTLTGLPSGAIVLVARPGDRIICLKRMERFALTKGVGLMSIVRIDYIRQDIAIDQGFRPRFLVQEIRQSNDEK